MAKITYLPDEKVIDLHSDATLLQGALKEGIAHVHACGGHAKCTTCRVVVLEGAQHCLPRNKKELAVAKKLNFPCDIRLACQTKVKGDIKIRRVIIDQEDVALVKQMKENKEPVSLGVEKEAAVLFADLQSFTTFTEEHLPYDVIHILNRYFLEMEKVITKNSGIMNNTMGDGFLALFIDDKAEKAVLNAVKAGLHILKEMALFNKYLQAYYKKNLSVRIGVHYGDVIMGSIGSRKTAIGDTINLASRIEAMNKQMKTNFLISETVYEKIKSKIIVGKSCAGSIRGKRGSYRLYEVLRLKEKT